MKKETNIDSVEIKSFEKFLQFLYDAKFTDDFIFRGVNDIDYELIPKLGREVYVKKHSGGTYSSEELSNLENKLWDDFCKMAVPYDDLRNISPWESLATAQHFGLPTRYLDWTKNPLIAAHFSVENATNDSAIYIINSLQFNSNHMEYDNPFEIEDEIILYIPPYINQRIIAQKGLFTVHKNPMQPLDKTKINDAECQITKLIIKKQCHAEFLNSLDHFGINRSFIYPGLDGLASYLDFKAKSR